MRDGTVEEIRKWREAVVDASVVSKRFIKENSGKARLPKQAYSTVALEPSCPCSPTGLNALKQSVTFKEELKEIASIMNDLRLSLHDLELSRRSLSHEERPYDLRCLLRPG
ncbi:MAG: hypothetical protein QW221_06960 [Candidatus Korarchaeum sp.]